MELVWLLSLLGNWLLFWNPPFPSHNASASLRGTYKAFDGAAPGDLKKSLTLFQKEKIDLVQQCHNAQSGSLDLDDETKCPCTDLSPQDYRPPEQTAVLNYGGEYRGCTSLSIECPQRRTVIVTSLVKDGFYVVQGIGSMQLYCIYDAWLVTTFPYYNEMEQAIPQVETVDCGEPYDWKEMVGFTLARSSSA